MSNAVDRRSFLKGLGALVAMPAMESLLPASAAASAAAAGNAPVRMAFLFVPNGIDMANWTPKAAGGAAFELSPLLEPLKAVQGQFSILTGLAQNNAAALGDGPGDHARSTACWLTGVHPKKTSGSDIRNGISADQVAAQYIGKQTRFASLELGCERSGMAGDCDSGYSCAYSSNISWKTENTPVAKETNPRLVFERLFGNGKVNEQDESLARRELFNKSILDFVLEDASNLKNRLGTRDARKLDEYLTSVREIEQRLVKFENQAKLEIAAGVGRPQGIPNEFGEHIRLMGDMMILAFQTDLTRIATFMFANDGSNRPYGMIGVTDGHHDVSHHGRMADKLEKKRKIDNYHLQQLAYILNRMATIKEGNGSLLDNTLLVYGAGISDGDRHNHNDLPVLLAGKGGGFRQGRHLVYEKDTPMNNLFVSMLDRVGVPIEKLGDSNGKLRELF